MPSPRLYSVRYVGPEVPIHDLSYAVLILALHEHLDDW